jgi:hypothetical protein
LFIPTAITSPCPASATNCALKAGRNPSSGIRITRACAWVVETRASLGSPLLRFLRDVASGKPASAASTRASRSFAARFAAARWRLSCATGSTSALSRATRACATVTNASSRGPRRNEPAPAAARTRNPFCATISNEMMPAWSSTANPRANSPSSHCACGTLKSDSQWWLTLTPPHSQQ